MKKITITTSVFLQALKDLKNIVDKKPVQHVMSNVHLFFDSTTKKVMLTVTDGEITMVHHIDTVEGPVEDVAVLLPFDFLYSTIELASYDSIILELKGKKATIVDNHDRTDISSLSDAADFPKLPAFPDEHKVAMDGTFVGNLERALATLPAIDSKVPWMSTVLLDIAENSTTIVSTDSRAMYTRALEVPSEETTKLLLRRKIVKALKGIKEVEVYWGKGHMAFKASTVTIFAKKPDMEYGPWRSVLTTGDSNVTFNRAELQRALEKVKLAISEGQGCVMLLKANIGLVTIQSEDKSSGRKVMAEVAGSYTGEAESITINPDNLLNLLDQLDCEELGMNITAFNERVLLSSPTEAGYIGMLMPIAANK